MAANVERAAKRSPPAHSDAGSEEERASNTRRPFVRAPKRSSGDGDQRRRSRRAQRHQIRRPAEDGSSPFASTGDAEHAHASSLPELRLCGRRRRVRPTSPVNARRRRPMDSSRPHRTVRLPGSLREFISASRKWNDGRSCRADSVCRWFRAPSDMAGRGVGPGKGLPTVRNGTSARRLCRSASWLAGLRDEASVCDLSFGPLGIRVG